MKKVFFTLLAIIAFLPQTLHADESKYVMDFNTRISTSKHDFVPGEGWNHIVDSLYSVDEGVSYFVKYYYLSFSGIGEDGSGCIRCGSQELQDIYDAKKSALDLLVSPKVQGKITIYLKKNNASGSINFYHITEKDGKLNIGDEITTNLSAVNEEDWVQVTIDETNSAERIGIRGNNIMIDDFEGSLPTTSDISSLTIHADVAGTLKNFIPEAHKYNIERLTVSGKINGSDLRVIRDLCGSDSLTDKTDGKVHYLDIKNADIVSGGEYFLQEDGYNYYVLEDNKLPDMAFAYLYKLDTLYLPKTLTSIGDEAFERCDKLKEVDIPEEVSELGWGAFFNSGVERVTLPSSIQEIPEECFGRCRQLTNVKINGSISKLGSMSFSNCNALKELELPEGLATIDTAAFINCYSLRKVNLPSTVKRICSEAFYGCNSVDSVYSYAALPAKCDPDAFCGINTQTVPLFVPYGTKGIYSIASAFMDFENIVEMASTGIQHPTVVAEKPEYYSLDGRKVSTIPHGGVLIVRYKGKTYKIINH